METSECEGVELPVDASVGQSNLTVSDDGLTSAGFLIMINAYAPALITVNGSGQGALFINDETLVNGAAPAKLIK